MVILWLSCLGEADEILDSIYLTTKLNLPRHETWKLGFHNCLLDFHYKESFMRLLN